MIGAGDKTGADPVWQLREAYRSVIELQKLIAKAKECIQNRNYGSAEGWTNSAEANVKLVLEHLEKAGKATIAEKDK